MRDHLSDEQLIARIEGVGDTEIAVHLEGCARCRVEEESLRTAVGQWAVRSRAEAERPAGFWHAQERAIHDRLAGRESAQRLTWAAALVTVALVATLALEPRQPVPTVPASDPDQVLLLEVQESVRRPVPRALEPALLLAQEVNQSTGIKTNR